MKIVVVMGTYRKNGAGKQHLAEIEKTIKSSYDAEFEYLYLGDYNLQLCRGCIACYENGEEACPLKDGYLQAIHILNDADAAIFYSPTYTYSISGLLKTFFDRSSFVLHRPYFKGRYALLLSTTMLVGEKKPLAAMDTIVSGMGFTIVGQIGIINEKYQKQPGYKKGKDRQLHKAALSFAGMAAAQKPIHPSVLDLLVFNMQKRVFQKPDGGSKNDRNFWLQKGWTDANAQYFCNASIPLYKRLIAKGLENVAIKTGLVQL